MVNPKFQGGRSARQCGVSGTAGDRCGIQGLLPRHRCTSLTFPLTLVFLVPSHPLATPQTSDHMAQLLAPPSAKGGKTAATNGAAAAAPHASDLSRLFHVGQFVRCIVTGLAGADSSAGAGAGAPKKAIQLSLRLKKVCAGLGSGALQDGVVVPACVKSAEDHGYTLDLGIKVSAVWRLWDAQAQGQHQRVGVEREGRVIV